MMKKNAKPGGRNGIAIDPARVEWIEARGDHSRVFTQGGSFMVRQTLVDLEKAWLANKIICISPEIMVNARRIKDLRVISRPAYNIGLHCGRNWLCEFPFSLLLNQILSGMHPLGRDKLRDLGQK